MRPILIIIAITGFILPACAESDVSLWVPKHMIEGQTYHGVVIMSEATRQGTVAFLSTGDDLIVQTPDSVTILPYKNHGVFPITPHASGSTEIFAAIDGQLYSASAQIFSSKSEPAKLHLTLPANKTRADAMTGYVSIYDENDSPVPADRNITVHIDTSETIDGPTQIVIRNGSTHARFAMDVTGTGHIIASTESLLPHRADIQKVQSEVTVRIAAAPKIAMQDSYVFYYVWLEKDGAPLRPPHIVDAFVHSGDPNVGRFGPNPVLEDSRRTVIHLTDGIGHGKIYTGERGFATITASIAEIGSAHDTLFVGPARFGSTGSYETVTLNEQDLLHMEDTGHTPNLLLSWVYPAVTEERMWGVAATYHMDRSEHLDQHIESGEITTILAQNAVVVPAAAEGIIHVSSGPGLEHRGSYLLEEQIMKTNAIEFEMRGASVGHYNITVSGGGFESAQTKVDVMPGYAHKFTPHMVEIPVIPHNEQDIVMVSILDETGAMVDADQVLGDVVFRISAGSAKIEDGVRPVHSGSAIIRGTMSEADLISAVTEGLDSASIRIVPARTATSPELLAPERVHAGEEFPFAVHHTDHDGIPIQRIEEWNISSPHGVSISDGMMVLANSGSQLVSLVSQIGATQNSFAAFENRMDVGFSLPKTEYRVGEVIRFDVVNSIDADYTVITDYPFEQITPGTFVITPDAEDESTVITLLATREGYSDASISETIRVAEIFSLDVAATGAGHRLAVPFDVTIGGIQTAAVSPYYTEFEPGSISVVFQEKITVQNRGYSLDSIRVNGETTTGNRLDAYPDGDIAMTASYTEEILIEVKDGAGSGVYQSGETVTVSAPDRHMVWILIRDVFERWDGLDSDSSEAEFTAQNDMTITAVYRTDYTYLMILLMVPLLAGGAFAVSRKSTGLRWDMRNSIEGILGKIPARYGNKKPKHTKDARPADSF